MQQECKGIKSKRIKAQGEQMMRGQRAGREKREKDERGEGRKRLWRGQWFH